LIARASQLFLPTLRDDPADADAVSHKLLVRGGFIRQVSAGVWTFLPLGWRVHRKIEQIIREEMDAIGGQEFLAPVLTPVELWEATGRAKIPELFHLTDRTGRRFILPMTHEETFTFHAREIQSYRELPQLWYHFAVKDRDEPRPRGGLLRVREFIMKDAYSFDRDEDGVKRSFEANRHAYHRIFERCGLEVYDVQAESGIMGGKFSIDFLAPSGSGENTLVICEKRDYAADLEVARAVPRPPDFPSPLAAPEDVATPGVKTCEELADFLGIDLASTSKAMPVVKEDGTVVLALLRGDDRLSETKLFDALPGPSRPATDEEIRAAFGAAGGSLGPIGFEGEVLVDDTLREGQFVAGANRDGWHTLGVQAGRDYTPRFADLREPSDGDRCPECGGALQFRTAVEVGHIFNFGAFYSQPLGATFLDEDGRERPLLGGSYGIGPGRVMAAIVEQHHDDAGIAWPRSVAPYDVEIVALLAAGEGILERAEEAAGGLSDAGFDVVLDDRDARPGEKFADADLIGCPIRLTVGRKTLEDGGLDVLVRATGEQSRVPAGEIATRVKEMV
jgi:prolyl-tRNA synthetase